MTADPQHNTGVKWLQYLLAAGLLIGLIVGIVLLLLWGLEQIPENTTSDATQNWRAQSKTGLFLIILALAGALGLCVFLIYFFKHLPKQNGINTQHTTAPIAASPELLATPSAMRLLGLLLLVLAILLMAWLYLSAAQQYHLLLNLIYPASFSVALVLLFDKATRSWSPKNSANNLREWLYCDLITFLLIIGFSNLLSSASAENYAAFFWDILHIALFFFIFWLLDRQLTKYRFIVALGYLMLLPILLLIWTAAQDIVPAETISWWQTIWPLFFLALVFFVLEIITLLAQRHADNQTLPVIKDTLFVVLYAILLIAAIPEATA